MFKLNSKNLRRSKPSKRDFSKIKRNPIYLVLHQIIDTYNIGSLFRLADAIAAEKLFLCGDMEYPPSSRIHKAAVGTEAWAPWQKVNSIIQLISKLKKQGVQIIVVEQSEKSVSYKDVKPNFPLAIVIGNETEGIDKEVLDEADIIVELPMFGVNKSFNVWGSAAVVAYKILEFL